MPLFKKKKEEKFQMTEPTQEMVKAQQVEEIEGVPEPEEIPMEETPKIEEPMTAENLDKKTAELNKRIAELNEREKASRPKERYQIVKELPMVPARQGKAEDGAIIHFLTIEEYLTAQANEE